MSMTMHNTPPATLPKAAAFILTHRLPCATLMVVMLMAVLWLPGLLQGMPLLATLATAFGVGIHILTPGLVALISFGGGALFAFQVTSIAAIGISAMAGLELMPGLIVLTLYGLLPIAAASSVERQDGVRKSAQYLATGLGLAMLAGLVIGSAAQNVDLRDLVGQLLAPMFDAMQTELSGTDPEAAQVLQQARKMTELILPGIMALGMWFAWWGDIVFARTFAQKYGFYQGHAEELLGLRFGKGLAYAFLALLVLANVGENDVQYVAVNAMILLGGLLAAQGIAVGHSWLKQKGMMLAIGLMYLMLLMWSAMIIPFVIIGLLDIWFDYRRDLSATGGQ